MAAAIAVVEATVEIAKAGAVGWAHTRLAVLHKGLGCSVSIVGDACEVSESKLNLHGLSRPVDGYEAVETA